MRVDSAPAGVDIDLKAVEAIRQPKKNSDTIKNGSSYVIIKWLHVSGSYQRLTLKAVMTAITSSIPKSVPIDTRC